MLTLPLEPTDDRAHPVFKDAAGCVQWLGQLQLTHLQLAHNQVLVQLGEFNRYPMRGLERLNTLELLRETVAHLQAELAKKLIDKPLPLSDNERTQFSSIAQLWQAMVTAYQRVLHAYIDGDKQLAGQGALICQRCLTYGGLEIIEYLRTGYEFNGRLWHQLHELYAYAEQQSLHQIEVADPLDQHALHSNCCSSYVKTLLICDAATAHLSRWQWQQMERWLSQWSNTVVITQTCTLSKGDAPPLVVDRASRRGLLRVEGLPRSADMRFLPMAPMSKLLRVKTILLQQGQTPTQVGLGEQYDQHACIGLLSLLHQHWCVAKPQRGGERRVMSTPIELYCGMEAIYAHLSGVIFKASDRNFGIDDLARKQLETLGRTLPVSNTRERVEQRYPLEHWQIDNKGLMDAGLRRTDHQGERLRSGQLLAFRASDGHGFTLAVSSWMRVAQNEQLRMGVRFLPGAPVAMRLRAYGINPVALEAAALLLPAMPSISSPPSLIIPRDWFQAGRVIEVGTTENTLQRMKLGFSVEHGIDFERVSFTVLAAQSPGK